MLPDTLLLRGIHRRHTLSGIYQHDGIPYRILTNDVTSSFLQLPRVVNLTLPPSGIRLHGAKPGPHY